MKSLSFFALPLAAALLAYVPDANAQIVANGSLTGPTGSSNPTHQTQPSGWGIPNRIPSVDPGGADWYMDGWSNSPDTWNANSRTPWGTSGLAWVGGSPTASPDGGTYVVLLSSSKPFNTEGIGRWGEALYQTIAGFEVGLEYELSVYTTVAPWRETGNSTINQYISQTSQLELETYSVTGDRATALPTSEVSFAPTSGTPFLWQAQTVRFTAVEPEMVVLLRNNYKVEDSSLLIDGISIAQVPEPSGLVFLGMAASFGLFRRRRTEVR